MSSARVAGNERAHGPVIGTGLHRFIATIALVVGLNAGAPAAAPAAPVLPRSAGQESLAYPRVWKGDLDAMKKRRVIRMLVVYSKTFYFLDKARQRGATYEAGLELEKELNPTRKSRTRPIRVVFIPTRRDHCCPRWPRAAVTSRPAISR